MKQKWICFFLIGLCFLLNGCKLPGAPSQPNTPSRPNNETMEEITFLKAAWIPTVYNLTYPKTATVNNNTLKSEIDTIILKAKEAELNAIFFQVRPSADAFYNSTLFPWSRFLTGKQGMSPNNNFDPLSYVTEECHKVGIELHAWLNPFRVTSSASETLISSHPAAVSPWLTFTVNGKIYFNPGEPAARQLIINGVKEIIENYNVDGIHYDDYFYPENIMMEDLDTFIKYGSENDIADWRRNNVDALISETNAAIKEISSEISFGVSPPGIWANARSHPLGSNTSGLESYKAIYADSRGWVKKEYVDYIIPQIYWYIGQQGSDFFTVIDWWHNVCKGTNVKLYTGLAGYKQDDTWPNSEELTRQATYASEITNGIVIYSFNDLLKNNVMQAIKSN